MISSKRGSVVLIVTLIAAVLLITTATLFFPESSPTGATIGTQSITGNCNISVRENIRNIGHDYICNSTDGFHIDVSNIIFDCQDHYIMCVGECNTTHQRAGIRIENQTNVTVKNCYIYNFTDGIKLQGRSSSNIIIDNFLGNNSNGLHIANSTANNLTRNHIVNSSLCGINLSNSNFASASDYNNIWNNNITNNTNSACAGTTDYSYWYLSPNKNAQGTCLTGHNILDGPCIAGNFWSDYTGGDRDGDGLGDTNTPHKGGKIVTADPFGDSYPLVSICNIPGHVCGNTTCPSGQCSSTGEGLSITCSYTTLDCNHRLFIGNSTTDKDDERGIEIINVHDITVKNCNITLFKYGIYIKNSYNITLLNNTLYNNTYAGVYVGDLSYGINITGNTFRNDSAENVYQEYGIHIYNSDPNNHADTNTILSNTIYGHSGYGIYLSDTSNYNTISSNTIYNNSRGGIFINSSNANNIYNNRIYNHHTGYGIRVLSSTLADFNTGTNRNNVSNNLYGYFLENSHSSSSNGLTGLIHNNTFGIYLDNSDPNLRYNTLYNNTLYGIIINNSKNINLDYNYINYSRYGIYAFNSTSLVFSRTGENQLFNNTYGLYFDNVSNSTLGEIEGLVNFKIYNNSNGIVFNNSHSNTLRWLTIYYGSVGLNLTKSNSNNITSNTFYNFTLYNIHLNHSVNNTIYDNSFDNTSGGIDAFDNGNNNWNISKTTGTNIRGGSYLGGNYWTSYLSSDSDNDGLGDTPYAISGGNKFDYRPLTALNISCGIITSSVSLTRNLTSSGDCFMVKAHNLTINCHNYFLIGRGSGIGINLTGINQTQIQNCYIFNFTIGIYLNNANYTLLSNSTLYNHSIALNLTASYYNTFSSNNIYYNSQGLLAQKSNNNTFNSNTFTSNSQYGIYLNESNRFLFYNNTLTSHINQTLYLLLSHNNTFYNNIVKDNTVGLNLTDSHNNTFYNNYFENTQNVNDTGRNFWNTTYNCSAGPNIIGGPCLGGNFWSNYFGVDNGSGVAPYNVAPWNISGDGIGDTLLPYNNTNNITETSYGDFLPLVARCGNISTNFILTQDLSVNGTCLTLTASNIVIDCRGKYIIGNNSHAAISLSNRSGITIKNCNLHNFTYGIYVDPSFNINITNTNITNTTYAIYFDQTNSSQINHTRLYNNQYGLYFNNSYYNNLTSSYIYSNSQMGIYLVSSQHNYIYNNNFTNTHNAYSNESNKWNISYTCQGQSIVGGHCWGGNFWSDYTGVDNGLGSSPYNNGTDSIGDTQIPYALNITPGDYLPLTRSNGTLSGACPITITKDTDLAESLTCLSGDALIIGVDNITLNCRYVNLSGGGSGAGIYLSNRKNVIIKNCNITNFYYGIEILHSENIQINSKNYLHQNDFYAVYQFNSTNTSVTANQIVNDNNGVYSISSPNTAIQNNVINLQKKFYGIYAYNSPYHTVKNNNMTENYHGIYLVNSDNANVTYNNLTRTDIYSLFLHNGTTDSSFLHNYFTLSQEALRIRQNSNNNSFNNNTFEHNTNYGLYSTDSSSNSFLNNTFNNNSQNVYLSNSATNTFLNNTIIGSTTGFQALSSSNSLTLHLNVINSSASPSLEINSSSSSILTNNTIHNNMRLDSAPLSIVSNNTIQPHLLINNSPNLTFNKNNVTNDFNLTYSHNLTITDNGLNRTYITASDRSTIRNNILKTLNLVSFSQGTISSNDIDNVDKTAFNFQTVTSTNISGNDIQNTSLAIILYGQSNRNNIYNNWLKNNLFGLNITNSTTNTIYNNYFQNLNQSNVFDDSSNTWSLFSIICDTPNIVGGPCQGGNFYSNYYGLDNGASSRSQGDGIGDQPSSYTITSSNVLDNYPLVLYVARQYFHPESAAHSVAHLLTAYGNLSGELSDEEVVPNSVQVINYTNITSNRAYLELTGLFNQSDLHAETLKIDINDSKTAVNKSGVTGIIPTHAIYLHHNYSFDVGAYLCPNIYNLSSANSTCNHKITFSTIGASNNINFSHSGSFYKFSNLTNDSHVVVLNKGDVCESNILHSVILSSNLNCNTSKAALNILADNIFLDFAGYALTGNGSGIGLNITNRTNVIIRNALIRNFSIAIYADPSTRINITNNNLTNNTVGIYFLSVNQSFITSNRITNNSLGINLSQSYNNSIYNNYFNNTNNALDNTTTNLWNTTYNCSGSTNILGGSCLGGNFWHNYTGWDTDLDGIGNTLNINITNAGSGVVGTDYFPLTETGKINCGGASEPLTISVTLNRNLTANGDCFLLKNNSLTFNCAGYTLIGNNQGRGILANNLTRTTIKNCYIFNFTQGIYLNNTNQSNLTSNYLYNNSYGLYLFLSYNNTIGHNQFYSNNNGTYLSLSNDDVFSLNRFHANSFFGVFLDNSSSHNFTSNIINLSQYALFLAYSNHSRFNNNTLSNNTFGLNLTLSYNNTFYSNFFNNTYNVYDNGNNLWNITYNCSIASYKNIIGGNCTGGNFWSNYVGLDNGSGVFPFNLTPWNISGDGIGDTTPIPYNNSGNITLGGDYLPLVYVAVTSSGGNGGSSSSSSSGGGGGGTRVTAEEELNVTCLQSWTCGAWSECTNSRQTRTCLDQNNCQAKKTAGEVTTILTRSKPVESRACQVEVVYQPPAPYIPPTPPPEKPSFLPPLPAVITEPSPVRTIALSSAATLVILSGLFTYFGLISPSARLRRRLRKTEQLLNEESSELLKEQYQGLYNLYLKISEHKKQKYYSNLNQLREKIESQLKAEKKIEELLEKTPQLDSLKKQKHNYLEINELYKQLSPRSQQQYYQKLLDLREQLEKRV